MSLEVDFENFKKGRVPGTVNNFSALVFMMIAKADPANLAKLREQWPEHVKMYHDWLIGEEDEIQLESTTGSGWKAKLLPRGYVVVTDQDGALVSQHYETGCATIQQALERYLKEGWKRVDG